ncbi:MAG: carboxypeptidase regulatory-like domain-containing protein [Planctomycetes bacterium]|nr:carboxypeptidase regulatory-like domain-containing protein [Planctomycetota bacterium]
MNSKRLPLLLVAGLLGLLGLVLFLQHGTGSASLPDDRGALDRKNNRAVLDSTATIAVDEVSVRVSADFGAIVTVVDARSKTPIAGARVWSANGVHATDDSGRTQIGETLTDDTVAAWASGYQVAFASIHASEPVVVELAHSPDLTIEVFDERGAPVLGAIVTLTYGGATASMGTVPLTVDLRAQASSYARELRTDGAGKVVFRGLSSGDHFVTCHAFGYLPAKDVFAEMSNGMTWPVGSSNEPLRIEMARLYAIVVGVTNTAYDERHPWPVNSMSLGVKPPVELDGDLPPGLTANARTSTESLLRRLSLESGGASYWCCNVYRAGRGVLPRYEMQYDLHLQSANPLHWNGTAACVPLLEFSHDDAVAHTMHQIEPHADLRVKTPFPIWAKSAARRQVTGIRRVPKGGVATFSLVPGDYVLTPADAFCRKLEKRVHLPMSGATVDATELFAEVGSIQLRVVDAGGRPTSNYSLWIRPANDSFSPHIDGSTGKTEVDLLVRAGDYSVHVQDATMKDLRVVKFQVVPGVNEPVVLRATR